MKRVIYVCILAGLIILVLSGCEKIVDIPEWKLTSKGIYGGNISDICFDPITSYIYTCSDGRVYLSKDNGENWIEIINGLSGINLTVSHIVALCQYLQ